MMADALPQGGGGVGVWNGVGGQGVSVLHLL